MLTWLTLITLFEIKGYMMKNLKKKIASAILIGMVSGAAYAGHCWCAEPDIDQNGNRICHQWVCW